jgi:hypothetical protein
MREEHETRRKRPPPETRPRPEDRPERGRQMVRERLKPMDAATAAVAQIAELTGRDVQGIVSLEPSEDGWVVGIEVVEDRRIPSSTDVLAMYEVEIDSRGELLSYTRKRRYARGKSDSGEMGP